MKLIGITVDYVLTFIDALAVISTVGALCFALWRWMH